MIISSADAVRFFFARAVENEIADDAARARGAVVLRTARRVTEETGQAHVTMVTAGVVLAILRGWEGSRGGKCLGNGI